MTGENNNCRPGRSRRNKSSNRGDANNNDGNGNKGEEGGNEIVESDEDLSENSEVYEVNIENFKVNETHNGKIFNGSNEVFIHNNKNYNNEIFKITENETSRINNEIFKTNEPFDDENKNNNNNTIENNNNIVGEEEEILQGTQTEGPWPIGHPLPLPVWSHEPKKVLKIPTVWQYEEIATNLELCVQKLLEEHNYNAVGNFLAFYEGFKSSGCCSLSEYFQM